MISILITHYNRIEALFKCLDAFDSLNLEDIEVIVSDDCSVPAIIEQLKVLKIDQLVLSKKNTGLASNLNRGLKACKAI